MLDRNQKTRIGFNEIFAHPVFAHLDWNKVANLEYIREFIITLLWTLDGYDSHLLFQQRGVSPR